MNLKAFISGKIEEIKKTAGKEKTISALSGGVDSSACTVLAARALGANLKNIFIDDGLMRQKEPESVRGIFKGLGIKVDIIDAPTSSSPRSKARSIPRKNARLSAIRSIPSSERRSGRAEPGSSSKGRSKRISSKRRAGSRPSTISWSRSASIQRKDTGSRSSSRSRTCIRMK